MNRLFIDTETTGLHPEDDSIIQIAGIFVNERNKVIDKFNYTMRPYKEVHLTEEASKVNGYTDEEIHSFSDPEKVLDKFIKKIKSNSKNDKLIIIGYNVSFDIKFIKDWFNTFDKDYYKYFSKNYSDVYSYVKERFEYKENKPVNFKQTTVYKYLFGKDLNGAHDAFADIKATKEIYDLIYLNKKVKKHFVLKTIVIFFIVCLIISKIMGA